MFLTTICKDKSVNINWNETKGKCSGSEEKRIQLFFFYLIFLQVLDKSFKASVAFGCRLKHCFLGGLQLPAHLQSNISRNLLFPVSQFTHLGKKGFTQLKNMFASMEQKCAFVPKFEQILSLRSCCPWLLIDEHSAVVIFHSDDGARWMSLENTLSVSAGQREGYFWGWAAKDQSF